MVEVDQVLVRPVYQHTIENRNKCEVLGKPRSLGGTLLAAIVTPARSQNQPLGMDFLRLQDGRDKQDCEHQAARRWLEGISSQYQEL
jgi:hypothetical protein